MYDYCYFSTITVVYSREKIGLIQIENLRKNNAFWPKQRTRTLRRVLVYKAVYNLLSSGVDRWEVLGVAVGEWIVSTASVVAGI